MTSSAVQIRLATLADLPSLADYNVAMAVETEGRHLRPELVLAGVRSLLESDNSGFYLVAEIDDRVIACLLVTYEWSDWRDGQFWWIQSVYVHPDHRRQGVFRRLYQEVERSAQQQPHVCGLRLYVEGENTVAQQTYRQLGMKPTPYRVFEQEFVRPPQSSMPSKG